jgi:two-component system, sensor histidine kinase LadS
MSNNVKSITFFFIFIFSGCSVFVNNSLSTETIILENDNINYSLGNNLQYFEDSSGELTLKQILNEHSESFVKNKNEASGFGFSESAFWFRFAVINKSNVDWLLEVGYPLLDSIELYRINNSGNHEVQKSGDLLPYNNRLIKHRNFIFKLPIESGERNIYYLRVKTQSSVQVPLTLYTGIRFAEKTNQQVILFGIYFGAVLVMVFYNLFLYLSIKDRNYLLYVLYLITYLCTQASLSGFSYEYLWPSYPGINAVSIPFFTCLANMFILCFYQSFLNTRELLPRLYKVMGVLIILSFTNAVLSIFTSYLFSIGITIILVAAMIIISFPTGFICWRRGYRPAFYFLIAWPIHLLAVFIALMAFKGILPGNVYTLNSMKVGSVLEVILLSLALADRINLIKKEKEKAQSQALANHKLAINNLKNAEKIQNDFLKLISHEMNTPLNGIMGITQLLSMDLTDPEHLDYCNDINISTKRLKKLSDIAKLIVELKKENYNLQYQELSIIGLFNNAKGQGLRKMDAKNITLETKIEPEDIIFTADQKLVTKVINDILNNSIEYSGSDSVIYLTGKKENNWIFIKIKDHGSGFPDNLMDKVFQLFTVQDIMTHKKGLGLSLAIAKIIMDLHQGRIEVRNNKGGGAEVMLSFKDAPEVE